MGRLCINRYPGQRIMIGDDISIYLWQVDGKRAQIVIEAPKSVKIRRPSKEQDAADLMTMRQTERGER